MEADWARVSGGPRAHVFSLVHGLSVRKRGLDGPPIHHVRGGTRAMPLDPGWTRVDRAGAARARASLTGRRHNHAT